MKAVSVKAGCILSPKLFNIYGEQIIREVLHEFDGGVKIGGQRLTNLRFADDTLLCSSKLMRLLEATKKASERRTSAEY